MRVLVGTSGYQYRHWRGRFYPAGVPTRRWLPFYAERFETVELNNPFYGQPDRATFERWAAAVPPGFVFAVKASRYLSHIRRLREPDEVVERVMEAAVGLGAALGPILVQLPPRFEAAPDRLRATLAAFGRVAPGTRVTVEFRDPSWYRDDVRSILERYGAALCLADRRNRRTPVWTTADWTYVRFHEGIATPRPGYGRKALETWAETLAGMAPDVREAYAYFNNDPGGLALRDAAVFARLVRRAGLEPTRTIEPGEVRVG